MRLFTTIASLALLSCAASVPAAAQMAATPSSPAPEARMVIARQISAIVVPDGSLRKIYTALVPQLMEAAVRGQLGNAAFDEKKNDPTFQERIRRTTEIVTSELGDILTPYEGKLREAYATAYSHQFDEVQLGEILAFYKTPIGPLFAQRAASLVSDPAIVNFQREIGPVATDALPRLREKIKTALADLPNNSAGARQ